MKKILLICVAVLLVIGMCVSLTGCLGNKDLFDTVYTYDYAIVKMPDGTAQTIELKTWTDYDGEQLQLTDKDGNIYLVNSVNCVLVCESD